MVRGKRYAFSGSKQRSIVRQLFEAWSTGNPECLTASVLETAEYSPNINTLAKARRWNVSPRTLGQPRAPPIHLV